MADDRSPVERLDVTPAHLRAVLDGLRPKVTDEEYRTLEALVETVIHLADLLARKNISLARLRKIIFGATTETTRQVLARLGDGTEPTKASDEDTSRQQTTPSEAARSGRAGRPGHGRHGAAAYPGARTITIAHPTLTHGDPCPACAEGKVYMQREPKVLLRFAGHAPISATVYALERLRCHLCGALFTAPAPAEVGEEKYGVTTGAMIAQLKYGSGVPFHRLAQLQAHIGIPLPASTQWEIVADFAKPIAPVLPELIRQAAHGEVLYNDDTTMTVLSLLPKRSHDRADPTPDRAQDEADVSPDRTGIFTSGIVATREGHRIALYFTGRRHAGENLAAVLAQRAPGLGPPIQMCDALSRNVPETFDTILANWLCHARRTVVDVAPQFPTECRYVLETLRDVYAYDAKTREHGLSADARLAFHQQPVHPVDRGHREAVSASGIRTSSRSGPSGSPVSHNRHSVAPSPCDRPFIRPIVYCEGIRGSARARVQDGSHMSEINRMIPQQVVQRG